MHGVRLPEFTVNPEMKRRLQISEDTSNYDFLRALCLTGFEKLKLEKNSEKYKQYSERAKYELETINELGFTDYILLVWEVINYCKENKIPTGLGRGSAASSLVLFLIGVTGVDPIKYDLYFERFISKTRAKKTIIDGITYLDGSLMVDCDLDIAYYDRPKVIEWLQNRFSGQTCKILTLNTLSGKLLIKECCKIIGNYNEDESKSVSDLIPKLHGVVFDLEKAYEEVPQFKEWADENPRIYKTALKLRDLIKNKGVHPSAILLSYFPIKDSCPTELSSTKEEVSSYDMNWAGKQNVKLDLLGLRTVSVVDDVCKQVGINLEDIDFEDPTIYQNLQDLKTPHGLFQIEADTVYKSCRKIKPKNLEEVSGLLAIARPGAMQFIDQYASFTNTGTTQSIHPFFDDILGKTGCLAIYQEQLMKMVNKIGFSLADAETVRRIVGKKLVKEMAEWEKKIVDKIKEQKLDPEIGNILWGIMDASKDYSFNRSHSFSYGMLSAASIYLKFNYPKEFFLSLLKMSRFEPDSTSEISKIHKEFTHFNIKLLPPHLLKSQMDFSIEGPDIRFGLSSIKGIAEKAMEKLSKFRNVYQNKFEIFQAANESKLPLSVLCPLIQAGALEGFLQSRTKVVLEAQTWNLLTEKEKKRAIELGAEFDYDLLKIIKFLLTKKDDKGKPVIKESRYETIKRNYQPYLDIYNINRQSERLANWYYERQLLGYNYYVTLKEIYQEYEHDDLVRIIELPDWHSDDVTIIASVKETQVSKSKKGTKYFKCLASDETGEINCFIFDTKDPKTGEMRERIEDCKEYNGGRLPRENDLIIIKGKRKEDAIFANSIKIQSQRIYTKLSELKAHKKELDKEIE